MCNINHVCVLTEPENPWIGELIGMSSETGEHIVRNPEGNLVIVPAHEIEQLDEGIA